MAKQLLEAGPCAGETVLSVQQPYAYLLCKGLKVIENRTWDTPHRGRLWIHASAKVGGDTWRNFVSEEDADFEDDEPVRITWPGKGPTLLPAFTSLPRGCIVGCVTLVDVVAKDSLPTPYRDRWDADGPLCWLCSGGSLLREPVMSKGKLRLWLWK